MNTFSIKEAAKQIGVQSHVLRYWEEELNLKIKRNEMGHRYYDESDIKILKRIKSLKDKGIQLKAINSIIDKMYEIVENSKDEECENKEQKLIDHISEEEVIPKEEDKAVGISSKSEGEEKIVDFKMASFQSVMSKIVNASIKENIKPIIQGVSADVVVNLTKQIDMLLKENEEKEEERYKKLDLILREYQQSRKEIAACETKKKKKKWLL